MRTYLRILAYGRRFYRNAGLAVFFLILHNLFGVVSLGLLIPFLEILFSANESPAPESPLVWYDAASLRMHFYAFLSGQMKLYGKTQVLVAFCVILVVCILLKNLFRYLSSWNIVPLEQEVVTQMRRRLFRHLSDMDMAYFTGQRKGGIMNVIISDVQVIQESVIGTVQNVINDPITMLTFLGAMLFISWKLTLFTLIVLPVTGYFISRISKSLKKKARQGQERLGNLLSVLDEFIGGIRIVKSFHAEAYEFTRYNTENTAFARMQIALKRRSDLASPVTEVLSVLVVSTIILYGSIMILGGSHELKASEFIGFIALFSQFITPIKTFSSAISRIQKGIASFNRVEEFLYIQPNITNIKGAKVADGFHQSLELCNVTFSYGDEPVLRNLSLRIEKGQMIALVGPSGSGKSTLADLLPRFYDPQGGTVLLDGMDIRSLEVYSLRTLMGIVSQEGILFNDTVLRNIAYGDPTPDLEKARAAARIAHADGFISNLSDGYHTLLGERGTRLSGGQRQRISIARAIYKNPPILILDEATSALDSESEKQVQEALDTVMAGRTSLVIAHRLSTIVHADQIIVLEKGVIREQGKHSELLMNNGLYAQLYRLQSGMEIF